MPPSLRSSGPAPRRLDCGLTLAEMLIALTLGLVTVLVAGRLLLLASGAHAAQSELGGIDDGGRYALELIGRAARQAGHADAATLAASLSASLAAPGAAATAAAFDAMPPAVEGFDDRSLTRTSPAIDVPVGGAINGSDVLALRFTGDGTMTGCAGAPVSQGEQGWSIFYVARDTQGEAELRCKYRGASSWSADALVAGVDGFQVLYGLDTDEPPDGVANRYVNADAIRAADAAVAAASTEDDVPATQWRRVVSLRIGLLLHGSRPTRQRAGSETFHLLGPGASSAADNGSRLDESAMSGDLRKRDRKLFAATFALARRPVAVEALAVPAPAAAPASTPASAAPPAATSALGRDAGPAAGSARAPTRAASP